MRRFGCVPLGRPVGTTCWDDLWQRPMPSPDAAARHTGAGVARRQAHHERMRDERAREAAAGDAELPPEDDAVEIWRVAPSMCWRQRVGGGPKLHPAAQQGDEGEAAEAKRLARYHFENLENPQRRFGAGISE